MKKLVNLAILLVLLGTASAQTIPYGWFVNPRPVFVDSNGAPLSGGKLFSYNAGTSTPAATYHLDTLGNITPNTDPIILDAAGSAEIRLAPQQYKFVLTDSNGVQLWAADRVSDIGQIAFTQSVLLNPPSAAQQTIVGPLAASWFIGDTLHMTSPGVRVDLLDPLTILDTPNNPPNLVTVPPAIAGQNYEIPDSGVANSTFVLSPGPPNWIANNAYALATVIVPNPSTQNNPCDFSFQVTTAGTSGAVAPTFSSLPCNLSPVNVNDGTVTWTNKGVYSTSNVLDCTKSGLTCLRTAYLYFEGGGCNNATAAMGWDTFGANSPVPFCFTGTNIQKGMLGLPGAATLLQESTHAATASTNVIPYPAATTAGDLLEVECAADGTHTISGATDGTNAYSKAKGVTNGATDVEIWYFNGNSTSMGAATNLTVTFTGSSDTACNWHEYAGIVTSSALDITSSNTGSGNIVTTGTTAGTGQNTELVLAAVGSPSNPAVTGQPGYVLHAVTPSASNVTVSSEGLVQQQASIQSGKFFLSTIQNWASVLATFKINVQGNVQAQRSIVLPQYFLPNVAVNSFIKYQTPIFPVANGSNPNIALSAAIVCTADGSTDDPAFNTSVTATPVVPASSANTLATTPLLALPSTGCAPGNVMHLQIQRLRYNVADSFEGFVNVNGVSLQFGISQ